MIYKFLKEGNLILPFKGKFPKDPKNREINSSYLYKGLVYSYKVYNKKIKKHPGIFLNEDTKKIFIVQYEKGKEKTIKNLVKVNLDSEALLGFIENTKATIRQNYLINMDEETVTSNNEDCFRPAFKDEDGILVHLVKTALHESNVSLKSLKFRNVSELNNFKRAILGQNSMGWNRFVDWLEKLDYEAKIVITKKKKT